MLSSILPILKPVLASALMAACAPGPGVLASCPPGARTLMWMAVMPLSLAVWAAWNAACMAAYGDDSIRSALTYMPPLVRAMVSAPVRSVMWTRVLLYEL